MRVATAQIHRLCEARGISLQQMLKQANVSRNAYYTLARHDSILPKSLTAIAASLEISPASLLTEDSPQVARAKLLLKQVDRTMKKHRRANRDNVRHTLLLLQEKPLERLRRSLTRGQSHHIHR